MSGPAPAPDDRGPLTGLRVLDVATLFAAPQVATMLGDLGADVVKVESPEGDPLRAMGHRRAGRSTAWELVGRNKRSIALDLDTDGPDRATFRALVAASDVLVENLTPALRERRGVHVRRAPRGEPQDRRRERELLRRRRAVRVAPGSRDPRRGVRRAHAHDRRGRRATHAPVGRDRRHAHGIRRRDGGARGVLGPRRARP